MQRGGGTVDETIMLRHALDGLPVYVHDSATSSGEAREYLRDNPDTRLALLDDGLQNLALVRCVLPPRPPTPPSLPSRLMHSYQAGGEILGCTAVCLLSPWPALPACRWGLPGPAAAAALLSAWHAAWQPLHSRTRPDLPRLLSVASTPARPLLPWRRSDLEIVMVNGLCPFGNGHLLPRGTLRELPKQALRRADALVLHNVDLLGEDAGMQMNPHFCCLPPLPLLLNLPLLMWLLGPQKVHLPSWQVFPVCSSRTVPARAVSIFGGSSHCRSRCTCHAL
jgi:hypothetical protein